MKTDSRADTKFSLWFYVYLDFLKNHRSNHEINTYPIKKRSSFILSIKALRITIEALLSIADNFSYVLREKHALLERIRKQLSHTQHS